VPEIRIAFLGAGAIARYHACALDALPHCYPELPPVRRVAIAASSADRSRTASERLGFEVGQTTEEIARRDDLDAIFVLSPNALHGAHLQLALCMPGVARVYLEKPFCATADEESALAALLPTLDDRTVQVGFQFLQMATVRRALIAWRDGAIGRPIHFQARYLHGGYLDAGYRAKRGHRLVAAPAGGATADLGSHAISLLTAFLGPDLEVVAAARSGAFPDVPPESDLCATALLRDPASGAAGTLVASRVSAGSGDTLELEISGTDGALRLSTRRPDLLELCTTPGAAEWTTIDCGNDYRPVTSFPFAPTPSGWLRSLVHAQYLFLGGRDDDAFRPDAGHALETQRIVRSVAQHLSRSGRRSDA
jgi:predicted dehydrogenase